MSLFNEFKKISNAFKKVKEDMDRIRISILDVQNEKANRTEVESLIRQIELLNLKITKINAQGPDYRLIGNKESKMLHITECPYAKKINSENKVFFDKRDEALKEGYNLCSCILNN